MSAPASLVDQCSRLAVVGASASDCIDCVRTMLITALWLAVTCLALGLQAVSGQVPVSFDHGERSNHIYCQCVGSQASIAPSCVAESYNLNVALSNVAPPYRSPCFMTDGTATQSRQRYLLRRCCQRRPSIRYVSVLCRPMLRSVNRNASNKTSIGTNDS